MDRKRVLFICVGNTARSLMAEAILRSRAGDRYDVASAGVKPSTVPEQTLQVLAEAGIDTSGLHSKSVLEYLATNFYHYVITVCEEAEEKCPRAWLPGGEKLLWPVADPAAATGTDEEILQAFTGARAEITRRIDEWLSGEEQGHLPTE